MRIVLIVGYLIRIIISPIVNPKAFIRDVKISPIETIGGSIMVYSMLGLVLFILFADIPSFNSREAALRHFRIYAAKVIFMGVLTIIGAIMIDVGHKRKVKQIWMTHTERDLEDYEGRGYLYRIGRDGVRYEICTERGRTPNQEGLNVDEWKKNKYAFDTWHQRTDEYDPHFFEWVAEKRKDYNFRENEKQAMKYMMERRADSVYYNNRNV